MNCFDALYIGCESMLGARIKLSVAPAPLLISQLMFEK